MSEENVERVRAGFGQYKAGMERGDPGAAFESGFLAPDMEWFPLRGFPGASVYRGRHEFAEFMRMWTEDFEDWTIRLDQLIDAPGGQVVAFVHQTGTGKGSGAPVEVDLGTVFKLVIYPSRWSRDVVDVAEEFPSVADSFPFLSLFRTGLASGEIGEHPSV